MIMVVMMATMISIIIIIMSIMRTSGLVFELLVWTVEALVPECSGSFQVLHV